MECTDLLSVIFLNYKIMNIDLVFNRGDHVKLVIGQNRYYVEGYIVGFKYIDHCNLDAPFILYAVMATEHYIEYKECIDKGDIPFKYQLWWGGDTELELIK